MTGRNTIMSLLGALALANLTGAEEVSLSRDVMPLITRSCTGCHQREGGNDKAVDQGPYLEKNSDILRIVGTMIIPGKPESSYLLMTMSKPKPGRPKHKMMPPKNSKTPGLSEEELQKVSDWIKAGAKDN